MTDKEVFALICKRKCMVAIDFGSAKSMTQLDRQHMDRLADIHAHYESDLLVLDKNAIRPVDTIYIGFVNDYRMAASY